MNNTSLTKSFIFDKKINNNQRNIPLNIIDNTLNRPKHVLPATKEWHNSVYSYNQNYTKNLSIADKNLLKIITSYFNLFFKRKVIKEKRVPTRFKRLSMNSIVFSKAELKHTSDNVNITLYIYNEERRLLLKKIKNIENSLFTKFFSKKYKTLTLRNKLSVLSNENLYNNYLIEIAKEYVMETNYFLKNHKYFKGNVKLKINELINKSDILMKLINTTSNNLKIVYKEHAKEQLLEKELTLLSYYKLLLKLNKSKFEDSFLSRIKPIISRMYNKNIEFNIINLKNPYFSTDIFTQIISKKIKNRKNNLLSVLTSSLKAVKMPNFNKASESYVGKDEQMLWLNKAKNITFNNINNNNDLLNNNINSLLIAENTSKSLENRIIEDLKYKDITGVRFEAKGRLTKRFTASRSLFKVKWKGTLKNIDSTYKNLSSAVLRGHFKSNIQHSVINSKTRNGSFGLKGWISSK